MNTLILIILLINIHKIHVYKHSLFTRLDDFTSSAVISTEFHQLGEEGAKKLRFLQESWGGKTSRFLPFEQAVVLEENGALRSGVSTQRVVSDRGKKTVKIAVYQPFHKSTQGNSSVKATKQAQPCQDGQKRLHISRLLQKYIGAEAYPVVEGILLGGSSQLTRQQKDQVKIVGLSHVMSASGSNVSLFLILNSPYLWRKFGKVFTGFITGCCILIYLQLAGCSAPLIRASVSTGLALFGGVALQQRHTLWLLAVTCVSMIITQPSFLTNIGFQLSVAATLGIVCASKALPKRTSNQLDTSMLYIAKLNYQSIGKTANSISWFKKLEALTNYIITGCKEVGLHTCAAQLATLPITLYYFKEFSLSAIVSNVLVLWSVPWILYGSVVTAAFSVLHLHIPATISGAVTTLCTQFFLTVVQSLSNFSFALLTLPDFLCNCILFIYFLCILIYFIKQYTKKKLCSSVFCH